MIEPNEFKGENMMHSIKSMGKCDSDNDESTMKKEKNQMKDMDYDKKDGKQQDLGWNMDWSAKMGKEMECEKKQEKKEMNKCEPNKKYSKTEMSKESTMEKMTEGNMGMNSTMMQGYMKPCKGVTIGDKMPKMKVQTTMGMKTLPDDYMGKWLMLFSHPGDFTPVCTTEFISFAKNYDNFKQLDTELLGLSVDQVQPHIKWVEWMEEDLCTPIPFPIIADSMGTVASQLGMMHSTKTTQTVRAVFIIDPTGTIRMILYYPSEVGRNVEEIIRAIAALQIADKHKVAMPANWPNNELIGDQVIVPPPTTREGAKKNKEMYCNYDWWFAYKPLE